MSDKNEALFCQWRKKTENLFKIELNVQQRNRITDYKIQFTYRHKPIGQKRAEYPKIHCMLNFKTSKYVNALLAQKPCV